MIEFEVGGNKYLAGKLDAMKQFHIARRVAPVIGKLGSLEKLVETTQGDEKNLDQILEAFEPVLEMLGEMKDSDVEYVLNGCLDVVKIQQAGQWVNVRSRGGLMFDFIDMPTMVQIAWQVLQANLLTFSNAPRSPGKAGAGQGQA